MASEPFAGDMVRAAIEAALLHDHLLLVGETQGDPTVEDRVVKAMLDRAVSGFIYASMFTRQVRVSRVLRAHRLVLLNCTSQSQSLPAVVPDEHAAGVAAATALLTAGHHQRIFLIGETPSSVYAAEKRRAGIEQTLTAAGTALAGAVDCRWWPEPAYDATHALLADGARPSAVICLNDRVAMGVYQALNDAGLTIPTDISVVSFDDSDLAAWLRPALTSVALPHYDMGRRAIELLLTTATIGPQPPIPMPLRHRASISHPPQL